MKRLGHVVQLHHVSQPQILGVQSIVLIYQPPTNLVGKVTSLVDNAPVQLGHTAYLLLASVAPMHLVGKRLLSRLEFSQRLTQITRVADHFTVGPSSPRIQAYVKACLATNFKGLDVHLDFAAKADVPPFTNVLVCLVDITKKPIAPD